NNRIKSALGQGKVCGAPCQLRQVRSDTFLPGTTAMLDSDIRRLLDTFFKTPNPYPPDIGALRPAAEETPRLFGGVPEAVYAVDELRAPGPAGTVPIRTYRPRSSVPLPLVLFAHGGGWVAGSLDSHDKLC